MYVWSPWNILWFCWMSMCLRAVCIRWFRYVIIFPNKSAILSSFHSRITDKFKNSNTIFDLYGNSSHVKPKQNCRHCTEWNLCTENTRWFHFHVDHQNMEMKFIGRNKTEEITKFRMDYSFVCVHICGSCARDLYGSTW